MSPELLLYFTSYNAKEEPRKLKAALKEGDRLLFEVAELDSFDEWLKKPWPVKAGQKRPSIPSAIRQEIQKEAHGQCALCRSNADSCEAAHIAPVATSKSNHPHNLIWLCAHHHTVFDKGLFGAKGEDSELIKSTKICLQATRKVIWGITAEWAEEMAKLLAVTRQLNSQMKTAQAAGDSNKAALVHQQTLEAFKLLKVVAKKNSKQELSPLLQKLTNLVELSEAEPCHETATVGALDSIVDIEDEFLREAGLKHCPLCKGSRWHGEHQCPVCEGEGSVSIKTKFDLTPFELLECRLCEGVGSVSGATCSACGGEGTLERRLFDCVDWSGFDEVDCPLCKATGTFEYETCPECHGYRRLPRSLADRVDTRAYEKEECELCEGTGTFWEGHKCPNCNGENTVPKGRNEALEKSQYKLVECPHCKGTKFFHDDYCLACEGTGTMPWVFAERLKDGY